jgi:hypothetical protein
MKWVRSCGVLVGLVAAGCATGSADSERAEDGGVALNDASVDDVSDAPASGWDGGPWHPSTDDGAAEGDDAGEGDDASGSDTPEASAVDAAAPDAGPSGDAGSPGDGSSSDADAGPVDIARAATAYTWQSMLSSTADTGRLAAPALNDGSLATQVNIDSASGDVANAWEGAGVVFASPVAVVSVLFVQGKTGAGTSGDGWFEAGFALQISADGTTWMNAGWTANPAYAYSSAVSGKTFTFQGLALGGVRGVRVVGQVNTTGNSWWEAANEVIVYGP